MFKYEVWHRYLPEASTSLELEKQFAVALSTFTEVEDIRRTGSIVEMGLADPIDRLIFAAYPPTGSLYAVVVKYHALNTTGTALYGVGVNGYHNALDWTRGTTP